MRDDRPAYTDSPRPPCSRTVAAGNAPGVAGVSAGRRWTREEGYKSMSVALVSIEKIGKCP